MTTARTSKPVKLKYRLRELYDQCAKMPAISTLTMQQVAEILKSEFGIPPGTFRGDMMIPVNSIRTIREDRLVAYAQFFGVSVDALRNYKPAKGRSLSQIILSAEYQNSHGAIFATAPAPLRPSPS